MVKFLVTAIGIGLMLVALRLFVLHWLARTRGEPVEARVVHRMRLVEREPRISIVPVYEYEFRGRQYQARYLLRPRKNAGAPAGSTVSGRCWPERPNFLALEDDEVWDENAIILGVIGAALLVLGIKG